MKIGVYVGSFNPIHNGHKHVVNYLLDNKYVDKVIVVPTLEYWNKHNLVNLNKREDMINLAFKGNVIVKSFSDLHYTYQIMENIQNEFKECKLYLILGADNLSDFDKWKNVDKLFKYHIIVINRNDIEVNLNKFECKDRFILLNDFPFLDVSSTYVRMLIKRKCFDKLDTIMDKDVIRYILDNKLYLED